MCFELFFAQYDIVSLRPMWMGVCTIVVTLSAVLTVPFMCRRQCKGVFLTSLVISFMSVYLFGYYIHEKHFVYAYLGILLNLDVYNDLVTLISVTSAYSNFMMAAWNANAPCHLLILAVAFVHTNYCQQVLGDEPQLRLERRQEMPASGILDRYFLPFRDWLRRWHGRILISAAVYMAPFYILNLICELSPPCLWMNTFRGIWVYSASFVLLLICYIYSWVMLHYQASNAFILFSDLPKLK